MVYSGEWIEARHCFRAEFRDSHRSRSKTDVVSTQLMKQVSAVITTHISKYISLFHKGNRLFLYLMIIFIMRSLPVELWR
jgi:hypothetical protein